MDGPEDKPSTRVGLWQRERRNKIYVPKRMRSSRRETPYSRRAIDRRKEQQRALTRVTRVYTTLLLNARQQLCKLVAPSRTTHTSLSRSAVAWCVACRFHAERLDTQRMEKLAERRIAEERHTT
ncbi:unnamed protein product [Xylocopa violacea]|uniref:Uncharacterized protein n=1 Tax=Xylocopa violacea TaxID=135666 RepID=A0ABP1NNC4_XYLVO